VPPLTRVADTGVAGRPMLGYLSGLAWPGLAWVAVGEVESTCSLKGEALVSSNLVELRWGVGGRERERERDGGGEAEVTMMMGGVSGAMGVLEWGAWPS
jgi:hypothetical protein